MVPESAGAGRTRGGFGQIMEIGGRDDLEFACNAIFDRISNPPKGRDRGHDGAAGRVELKSGAPLRTKGFQIVPEGDRLMLYLPGGGGMGNPAGRDPARVASDVRDGLISAETARRDYRVVLAADGAVNEAATAAFRGADSGLSSKLRGLLG